MTTHPVTSDQLGGYRLVRKLGEGVRAQVYLGSHGFEAPGRGESPPVAIKIFNSNVSDVSIGAEIEALVRADGPHSLHLIDVTTAPDGHQALILERLTARSIGRLLSERQSLRAGEAITLLAPLANAMSRLHQAGVVHGGIRLDAVMFDGIGSPVLACFGRSFPIAPGQPPALLDAVPGVALDIRSFASVARSVLAAVDTPSARSLVDWVESSPALETDAWFDQLSDRLFDLAEPEAVDLDGVLRHRPTAVPNRIIAAPARRATAAAPAAVGAQSPRVRELPDWLGRLAPSSLVEIVESVRSGFSAVRPRVWVVAGVAVAAFTVAALVVPQQGHVTAANGPVTSSSPAVAQATGGPVTADDPVAALVVLLAVRQNCIRDLSVLCLDAVGEQGSAALAEDRQLVQGIQKGAASPAPFAVTATQVTVGERLGDSVLLKLGDVPGTAPSSVLLMKGSDGWRIRDYLGQ